ncbi:MAG TPA: S9 family peptidase [Sphingomonadaceae bacterium]|nr:S9 family peptidase [Sphingomonadaceae bacterium]
MKPTFPLGLVLPILVSSFSVTGLSAAEPAAVTLEDYYNLADVAGPAFSPDGERIAYSVTRSDQERDQQTSDLWVVPWQGGQPRQLTKTPDSSEWQPHFGQGGKALFFLSDRAGPDGEEDVQLWSMPGKGGKARRITAIPGGISDYTLSPDATRAVVVAEQGRNVGRKTGTQPPIEVDRFFFKYDGRGYLDDRSQQLLAVDLASGKATPITSGARDHWHPAWSPDGSLIAYVAKDHADDRTLNYEIFVVSPDGGKPRKISTFPGADNDPDWGSGPSWSPDSRKLVWLQGGEDKWIYYGSVQLAVGDLTTGEVTHPAWIDRWFYSPHWSPDGQILSLIEQDRDTLLARIDPGSGKIDYLTQGSRFGYDFAVAPNGRIALLDTTSERPAELVSVGTERVLTQHNKWLSERKLGETRDISFMSGNTEIHGFMILPPDYDPTRKYPVIVDLHGGPVYQHSHEFDIDARLFNAAGYLVLKINPRGSSGRGFDFSRAIYADWGNLDVQDISAGITYAIDQGIADPERIGVGGWSYGGILADYMIARDKRIGAAVSGAGVANALATFGVDMYAREYMLELGAPWENFETWRKLAYPFLESGRITAPTLFQCAGEDDNVPCAGAQQMYLALKTHGVPTRLIVYPSENHGLSVPSYLIHRIRSDIDWYDRWLKPTKP